MMKILSQLIKNTTKFFKLSWDEQRLLFNVFFLTGIVRFVILFIPFKKLAVIFGKYKHESTNEISDFEKVTITKVGWAVASVSRYTPWETKCLVKALTAQIMLRKNRISSTLYLGVAKDENNKPIAHAWLRSGSTIVTGGQGFNGFTQVAKFENSVGRKK